jgi:hypothetical protein
MTDLPDDNEDEDLFLATLPPPLAIILFISSCAKFFASTVPADERKEVKKNNPKL